MHCSNMQQREEHYGVRSFLWQCRDRFGDELGYRVWEATNQTFDRMPLSRRH